MLSRSPLRSGVTLVLLGSQVSACTSWTTQAVSPEEFLREGTADEVRITRTDNTRLVLAHPQLVGDSVTGKPPDSAGTMGSEAGAVPLADIQSVAVRRKDGTKTTLFIVGLGVTAGMLAVALDDDPVACCFPY
jgi:hypothetical protein